MVTMMPSLPNPGLTVACLGASAVIAWALQAKPSARRLVTLTLLVLLVLAGAAWAAEPTETIDVVFMPVCAGLPVWLWLVMGCYVY